jgi:hypothetical protein
MFVCWLLAAHKNLRASIYATNLMDNDLGLLMQIRPGHISLFIYKKCANTKTIISLLVAFRKLLAATQKPQNLYLYSDKSATGLSLS